MRRWAKSDGTSERLGRVDFGLIRSAFPGAPGTIVFSETVGVDNAMVGDQGDGRGPSRASHFTRGGSGCPAGPETPHSEGFVALPRLWPFGPAKAVAPATAAADRASEDPRVFVEELATSPRLRAKVGGVSRSLRASPRQRLFRDRVLRTRPDRPGRSGSGPTGFGPRRAATDRRKVG